MNKNPSIAGVRHLAVLALLSGLLLPGCGGGKVAPVPVGELAEYRDPGIGFVIKYPKGWVAESQVGLARFYNAPSVDMKFRDPLGDYPNGVVIGIDVSHSPSPADDIKKATDDMTKSGFVVGTPTTVTVGGATGTRTPYTAQYSSNVKVSGHHVYIISDTTLYDLWFAGFGDLYEAYAAPFDAALTSFQLPKPAVKGRDETLPSETFIAGESKYFTYQYPENFNITSPPKGTFEFSLELHGYRQDCSIRFDMFDAKKLTVEKVFDQNKAKYRARSTGKATIGGESAMYLTYAATSQVDSRAYFAVHNDKVLRITLNWFKPQEKDYLPVFEKMISSIKFR